ncbi:MULTISPECIES: ABC transporter ATP-binding protein [Fischerella]|uniref:ABC transporter ATP-binding protein n=1 Tax=Fischerella muscicola CCMEE 5323 TaxID=2019572 RepID=A0A2N6K5P5_FISMU|nr:MULTISPECIES: ABC transporter ATP-binding protein [Fischerella]MBD2430224.1 ABC transporter ATP-binding protein [Fischerella sp. FACHB-380]PLZ91960.1 ABC transporter ATP-binding protein [Fischerella muscicola CCMEE 5323]
MASEPPLVEVIDLFFRHPGRSEPTIQGVNLNLYPGEIVLIAGATGSGKSTLLNCLAGIAPNHTGGELKGKILYQGTELNEWSVRGRSQYFCTVLQNVETQIFTEQVWEEIVFGLENWNVHPDKIPLLADAALREFGIEAQRNWLIKQLSAGQKQRLLIACLLTIGQPVMLLDEPLAYIDAKGVDMLLQLLRTRADRGQSIIIVEHRLDLVKKICDRSYYFQDGKLQEWKLDKQLPITPAPHHPITPILLQTHQLSWGGYPNFPDLTVAAEEIVLLKGENGSGKTTLLKLISGLLKPDTGKLEILGRDMSKRSVVQIAKYVGFVLQNPNHQLFADSVRAEILQPGVAPEVANSLLSQLNLSELAQKHPQSLSQGQKRRLALGAVLARQPKICLLDEIMVGQDPNSLSLMLNVLINFTQQGNALILTSHVPLPAGDFQVKVLELKQISG